MNDNFLAKCHQNNEEEIRTYLICCENERIEHKGFNEAEIRNWIINHLDLSKNWNVSVKRKELNYETEYLIGMDL